MGLRGLRGGTGGGTRLDEPTGRSQRTAGMFKVSGCSEEDIRPPAAVGGRASQPKVQSN